MTASSRDDAVVNAEKETRRAAAIARALEVTENDHKRAIARKVESGSGGNAEDVCVCVCVGGGEGRGRGQRVWSVGCVLRRTTR